MSNVYKPVAFSAYSNRTMYSEVGGKENVLPDNFAYTLLHAQKVWFVFMRWSCLLKLDNTFWTYGIQ